MALTTIKTASIGDDQVTVDKLANAINTDIAAKAPKASPTFTGTVAIPNIANLETAVAANTAKVTNATHTGDVTGSTELTIAANAVETGMIAADAVDGTKIANDSIDSEHYVDGSIDSAHLSTSARNIPENAKTTSYTLLIGDAGKHIKFTPANASQALTVPDSVFSSGDAITIVNNSTHNLAITKGTNMYYAADGTNASRTLAGRGVATLLFIASDTCYITGAGLS